MLRIVAVLTALLLCPAAFLNPVQAAPVFAIYNSSSLAGDGVTDRDASLNQLNFFNTPFAPTGIAAASADTLYLSSGNSLYRYDSLGNQVASFTYTFDPALVYSDIAASAGLVFSSYNSSSLAGDGVTIRDPLLNQLNFFNTPFEATGISARGASDIYLSSANSLYRYDSLGNLITSFTYTFDPALVYVDLSAGQNFLFAAFNSSSLAGDGVTVRDLDNLNQFTFFNTPFEIDGIAAGNDNDLWLSAANSLYHYDIGGNQLASFTYTFDPALVYSDISFVVPEPATFALFGLGLAGLGLGRRRSAA